MLNFDLQKFSKTPEPLFKQASGISGTIAKLLHKTLVNPKTGGMSNLSKIGLGGWTAGGALMLGYKGMDEKK